MRRSILVWAVVFSASPSIAADTADDVGLDEWRYIRSFAEAATYRYRGRAADGRFEFRRHGPLVCFPDTFSLGAGEASERAFEIVGAVGDWIECRVAGTQDPAKVAPGGDLVVRWWFAEFRRRRPDGREDSWFAQQGKPFTFPGGRVRYLVESVEEDRVAVVPANGDGGRKILPRAEPGD